MFSFAFSIIIFMAVIVITTVIFGGWVMFTVFRGFGRLLGSGSRYPQPAQRFDVPPVNGSIQCTAPGCRHVSPSGARFCRHCGRALPMTNRIIFAGRSHA
jgi:hypothetical protein